MSFMLLYIRVSFVTDPDMSMLLQKASQALALMFLMQLCIGGFTFAQSSTQPPPFGDKHVGGDVPLDERLTKVNGPTRPPIPAEGRVLTKGPLAPAKEDRTAFAAFLRMPDTGLIRLLQPGKVRSRPAIPGGGAYYSFANLTHFLSYGSDIGLSLDQQLSVGFFSGYGILTNLGDVPLENVSLTDPRVDFIASYQPAVTFLQARAETLRFRQTVTIEGNSYQATLPVELSSTYLVRSINYGKLIFGLNSSDRLSGNGRRTDVLVAFRIVRKDADESLIIAWKLLQKYPAPKLD